MNLNRQTAATIGHYQPAAVLALIAAFAAVAIGDFGAAVTSAVMMTMVIVNVVVALMGHHAHETRLCTRCVSHVPTRSTFRWRGWTLRAKHLFRAPVIAAYVFLVIAGTVVCDLFSPSERVGSLYLVVGVYGAAALYVVVAWSHRLLRPWCRWCREPGDGTAEDAPDPDPSDRKPIAFP